MMVSIAQRLIAAGGVCLVALVGLVILEGRARAAGVEVILPMQPVDPRALLTGHYVQLSFAEVLDAGKPCPALLGDETGFPRGGSQDRGWLALRRDGAVHVLVGAFATQAEAARAGEVVLRGNAHCSTQFVPLPGATDGAGEERDTVILDLDIDRFHADQDEALALEKILRDRDQADRVAAIVSVSKDGAARTKGVVIDGKRVELTWF
jgi:GDYXXLXY protein